jgi:hypothetical protein
VYKLGRQAQEAQEEESVREEMNMETIILGNDTYNSVSQSIDRMKKHIDMLKKLIDEKRIDKENAEYIRNNIKSIEVHIYDLNRWSKHWSKTVRE